MIDQIPHIEQYDGLFLMYEPSMRSLMQQVNATDVIAHVQSRLGVASIHDDDRYEVVGDGIAVISVEGAMTKYGSSMSRADATVELRRAVREASADTSIRGIMLRVDSPGGMVAGTSDFADDIAAAGKIKPIHAYIEDMGASAGYWVASQASRITVNRTAMVGSIGTYAYLIDYSGMFAEPGNGAGPIKTIEIKSTPLKGTGIAPGAAISDEQVANLQRELGEINTEFKDAVQRGRGYTDEKIEQLADARVHVGQNAVAIGLADAVGSLDDAINALAKEINGGRAVRSPETSGPTNKKEPVMGKRKTGLVRPTAEEHDEEVMDDEEHEEEVLDDEEAQEEEEQAGDNGDEQASIRDLKAAIPDSTAEFREECIEKGYTLAQAKDAHMDTLRAQLQNRDEQLKTSSPSRGVKRLRSASPKASTSGSPAEQVAELRDRHIANGLSRSEAHKRVMREHPELRAAYVQAANDSRPARRR